MFKNKIPWMIGFLLVAILTVWAIVSQSGSFSFTAMIATLKSASIPWMLAAVLGMFLNIFFEGKALEVLIRGLTDQKKNHGGVLYSAADIYFSAITPSATGGQPASAFFMIRSGISTAHSTVILLVNLIMYTVALGTVGVISLIFVPETFAGFDILGKVLVSIGYVFLAGLCILFYLLLKKEDWIRSVAVFFINLGTRMRLVRKRRKKFEKLDRILAQYRECADDVRGKWFMLGKAFFFNLLQRCALLSTTLCVYMGFGGNAASLPTLFGIQSMTFVGSYSIPIPGAMGVADYLLISGLEGVKDVANPANLELVSRGISFYSCIAISVVIVIAGYLIQKKRKSS